MAAANTSARGQRSAIMASPLRELTGFALVVDCRDAKCGGERSYAIAALSACYGARVTVGDYCAKCDAREGVAGALWLPGW